MLSDTVAHRAAVAGVSAEIAPGHQMNKIENTSASTATIMSREKTAGLHLPVVDPLPFQPIAGLILSKFSAPEAVPPPASW